jgi:hypothetical protein
LGERDPDGEAYCFKRTARRDFFGSSVSVNGVVAAVGTPDGSSTSDGAVYVFQETRGGWQNMTETAELTDGNAILGEGLGYSVVIEGGTLVAGAPSVHAREGGNSGRVLVYLEPANGWQPTNVPNAILTSTEVSPAWFGTSVAINPGLILVGDPYASTRSHTNNGAAFTFKKPASGWVNATQTAKITVPGKLVGWSVAAAINKIVFIGAPLTHVNGSNEGGAVFLAQ